MLLPIEFSSVNSRADLAPGTYNATVSGYAEPNAKSRITVFEYTLAGANAVSAVDLVVIDAAGDVRACDFVWLPDRSWRDSAGVKGNHLAELLPPELMSYRLVRREQLSDQVVEPIGVVTSEEIA